MPYLSFLTPINQKIELSGNNETEFINKLNCHEILHKDLAIQWVQAFFRRRNFAISAQKAVQAGDEDKADEYKQQEEEAEEEEKKAKEAYEKGQRAEIKQIEIQNSTQPQMSTIVQTQMTSNVNATEDDFM